MLLFATQSPYVRALHPTRHRRHRDHTEQEGCGGVEERLIEPRRDAVPNSRQLGRSANWVLRISKLNGAASLPPFGSDGLPDRSPRLRRRSRPTVHARREVASDQRESAKMSSAARSRRMPGWLNWQPSRGRITVVSSNGIPVSAAVGSVRPRARTSVPPAVIVRGIFGRGGIA